jgi:hypothetical protein
MIAKVFHVLRWTPGELDRTITALLEDGSVRETKLASGDVLLVSPRGGDQRGK